MRKPQLMVEDISVDEWQMFDYRSAVDVKRFFEQVFTDQMKVVAFHDSTIDKYKSMLPMEHVVLIQNEEQAKAC
ncbi:hypothetical protein, partial [Pseudomonas syringae group genomosp. 7]